MDNEDATRFTISFEDSESLKRSMLPALQELYGDLLKDFGEAKASLAFIENVKMRSPKNDGSTNRVDAAIENFEGMTDLQRITLQTYKDQATQAMTESVLNNQHRIFAERKLAAAETAIKRMLDVFGTLEPKFRKKMTVVCDQEHDRVGLIRQMTQLLDVANENCDKVKQEYRSMVKQCEQERTQKENLEEKVSTLNRNVSEAERKKKYLENKVEELTSELTDLKKNSDEINSELKKLRKEREDLSEQKSRLSRQNQNLTTYYQKEIARIQRECDERITESTERTMTDTRAALEKARNTINGLMAERDEYHKLYKDLVENYNNRKGAIHMEAKNLVTKNYLDTMKGMNENIIISQRNVRQLKKIPNPRRHDDVDRMCEALQTSDTSEDIPPRKNFEPMPSNRRRSASVVGNMARNFEIGSKFPRRF